MGKDASVTDGSSVHFSRYQDVLESPPLMSKEGLFRYWLLRDDERATFALGEMTAPANPHKHVATHAVWIVEGRGWWFIEDEVHEVGANDYVMTKPMQAHVLWCPQGGLLRTVGMTVPKELYSESENLSPGDDEYEVILDNMRKVGVA